MKYISKIGPILENILHVKLLIYYEYYVLIRPDKCRCREDSPQSTVLSYNLGHNGEPMYCMFLSKTTDTHLLKK